LIAIAPPLAEMPGAPAIFGDVQAKRTVPASRGMAEGTDLQKPGQSCDAQAAQDRIKAELFARSARLGGRDAREFAAVAERSLLRLQAEPSAARTGASVSCDGWLALDLPPGLAVDGGRTNLNSELHYAVVERDGRVRLGGLSGVEALVGSLATLARAPIETGVDDVAPPEPVPVPVLQQPLPNRVREPAAGSPPMPKPAPARAVAPAKRPIPANEASFSCRYASGRAEKAICGSSNLAALDKHLALLYSQSLGRADASRKAALIASDTGFASRRDACRSEKCLTAAYIARMREVSEIMARTGQQ